MIFMLASGIGIYFKIPNYETIEEILVKEENGKIEEINDNFKEEEVEDYLEVEEEIITDNNDVIIESTNSTSSTSSSTSNVVDSNSSSNSSNTTITNTTTNINTTTTTKYTVTFNSDGGTTYSSQSIESGKTVSNPGTPVKSGYTFEGWVLNGLSYNFSTSVTSNITLVALWKEEVDLGLVEAMKEVEYSTFQGANDAGMKAALADTVNILGYDVKELYYGGEIIGYKVVLRYENPLLN